MKYYFIFLFFISLNISSQEFEQSIKKTDDLVTKFQKRNNIPGLSVSISYKNKLIYSKGFGLSNIETKESVSPSKTKFRIASMTKSLTALTIGRLMELDSIDINKSVYLYLKNLPKKKYDFTIKDVGGHLSGMIRVPTGERYDCKNTYSQSDFYKSFENDSFLFAPGTQFSYSNYGYKLLGLIVEQQCGSSITNCQKRLVLDPLNLKNITPDSKNNENLSTNFYIEENGKNTLAPCLDCTFKYAQGCYLSTSEDIVKLSNALLYKDKLLHEETLNKLIKSQETTDGHKTGYGFGFISKKDFYGNYYFGHNGGYSGTTTEYRIYPKKHFVITVLTNKSGNFRLDELLDEITYNFIEKI
jgi:serine beta-lactamase-like protein LACTB